MPYAPIATTIAPLTAAMDVLALPNMFHCINAPSEMSWSHTNRTPALERLSMDPLHADKFIHSARPKDRPQGRALSPTPTPSHRIDRDIEPRPDEPADDLQRSLANPFLAAAPPSRSAASIFSVFHANCRYLPGQGADPSKTPDRTPTPNRTIDKDLELRRDGPEDDLDL
jgi:hypothetical protein